LEQGAFLTKFCDFFLEGSVLIFERVLFRLNLDKLHLKLFFCRMRFLKTGAEVPLVLFRLELLVLQSVQIFVVLDLQVYILAFTLSQGFVELLVLRLNLFESL